MQDAPTINTTENSTAAHGPEFIRLPKPGSRCAYTALSRSSLNELVLPCEANGFRPPVRSVVLKKRHAVRGIRLISYSSLIDYLNSLGSQESDPGYDDQ
jgi:hypothetical protein